MRDVTYTHTALTADAADRIGRRQGAGMWAFGLALIIIMAGAFVVGKALISTALRCNWETGLPLWVLHSGTTV